MQQCVQKLLKAFLIFEGKEIIKTHDIALLIRKCAEIDKDFNLLFDIEADSLTDYAVSVRYGEEFYFPSINEAKEAIEIWQKVKEFVLAKLRERGFSL